MDDSKKKIMIALLVLAAVAMMLGCKKCRKGSCCAKPEQQED